MPLSILAAFALATADETSLGIQDAKLVDAALFKNGYCVVTSEAEIPATGELLLEAPRNAVLGTFWLRAADGKVMTAVNGYVPRKVSRDPQSVDDYLARCLGKQVTLETPRGDLSGILETMSGAILALRIGGGVQVINRNVVTSLRVVGEAKDFKINETLQVPVLKVSGLRGTKVQLSMMQQGLWWSPAYNIDISNPDRLVVTARAVIADDLADLSNQSVRLVTGFPNLPFLGQMDPIVVNSQVSAVVAQGGFAGRGTQALGLQFANREASTADRASFQGIDMEAVQGFAAEDLFMYPQSGISIKKGDRLYRQLFQANSGYEHLHTLEVPNLVDTNGNRAGGDGLLDVWHEIKFTNKAGLPLTTGPATVMKGNDVIGQDTLTYTSKDQDARVKISKAIDIGARQQEEEKGRERGFIKDRYNNPRFDRLTVGGTIEIRNRKATDVKMEVSKTLYGDVVTAGEAKVVKEPTSMWEVNPVSRLKWTITLKAGETRALEYTYTVLRNPI